MVSPFGATQLLYSISNKDHKPDKRAGAVLKTDGTRKGVGCKSSVIRNGPIVFGYRIVDEPLRRVGGVETSFSPKTILAHTKKVNQTSVLGRSAKPYVPFTGHGVQVLFLLFWIVNQQDVGFVSKTKGA